MPLNEYKFEDVREAEVSQEMTKLYFQELDDFAECDIAIVGAGPSGLCAAYEASKNPDVKIAVVEASVACGGGGWVGGQLFSAMIIRKPAHKVLDELEIPYDDKDAYVVVKHAALFTSTLISKVVARPNVKLFNATACEDFIIRSGVVGGLVTNWSLVTKAHGTQSCMDPQVLEAKVVISSCGHDGPFGATGVKRLAEVGLIDKVPGMKALDMNASEDAVVNGTREVVPGMIVTGMEVAELDGTPRMGPTFGGMIISGLKAGNLAAAKITETEPNADYKYYTFAPIKESVVAREMTRRYRADMLKYSESDVIIVGAGPSGLSAAYELSKFKNVNVALIEASVAPGGGAWVGGQLFSGMVIRKPAHAILNELDIEYDDKANYVVVKHAALFTSTILSKLLAADNVKLFNATAVEDLIVKNDEVRGVVTNWTVVSQNHGKQSCMDPQVLEAKVVISSCGHDGPFGATGVKRLAEIGLLDKGKPVPGMKALDMVGSEDAVVENTREIVPGMIVTGMEATEAAGGARMGPTFGAMLASGQKGARLALNAIADRGVTPVAAA